MEHVDFVEISLYVTDISIFILIFTLLHIIKKNRNKVLTALKPRIRFNTQQLKLGLCVCVSTWAGYLGSHLQSKEIESLLSSV